MRARPSPSRKARRHGTTTGTADELVDRVRGLAAAGYAQLAVCLAPGHEDALDDWARGLGRV
jgi:hypothetical protein